MRSINLLATAGLFTLLIAGCPADPLTLDSTSFVFEIVPDPDPDDSALLTPPASGPGSSVAADQTTVDGLFGLTAPTGLLALDGAVVGQLSANEILFADATGTTSLLVGPAVNPALYNYPLGAGLRVFVSPTRENNDVTFTVQRVQFLSDLSGPDQTTRRGTPLGSIPSVGP